MSDYKRPEDHAERMRAAEAYARWHLGSAEWAYYIVKCYEDPEWARKHLAAEQLQ